MEEEEIETRYEDAKQDIAKIYQKEMEQYKAKRETNIVVMKQKLLVIENKFHAKFKKLHENYEKQLVQNQKQHTKREIRKARLQKALWPFKKFFSLIGAGIRGSRETIKLRRKQIRKWWIERGKRVVYRPLYLWYDQYLMYWHPVRNFLVLHFKPPLRVVWRPFQKVIDFFVKVGLTVAHYSIEYGKKGIEQSIKISKVIVTKSTAISKGISARLAPVFKKISEKMKVLSDKIEAFKKKFAKEGGGGGEESSD